MASKRSEPIMTPEARICFPALFQPKMSQSQKELYSATLLIPKTVDITAIRTIVQQVAQEAWPQQWQTILAQGDPIKDGDTLLFKQGANMGQLKSSKYPEFAGHWVIDATRQARDKNNQLRPPPPVVDQNVQPILDSSQMYAGAYAVVNIVAWTYENQNYGVGIGINALQKTRDGDRLAGGAVDPNSLFAPIPAAPGAPVAPAPVAAPAPGTAYPAPPPVMPGAAVTPMAPAPMPAPQPAPGAPIPPPVAPVPQAPNPYGPTTEIPF